MNKLHRTLVFVLYFITSDARKNHRKIDSKPHIILILADDLGWNEVSWHNNRIKTPYMEDLSEQGVRLEQSYVSPKCSPSRAALMTGIYPFRIGLQRGAIERFQATGLNTSIQILPQFLKTAGYKNHLVGKWHLGYCHEDYLPNNRGFDTFLGQYNHVTDYYTRKLNYQDFPPNTEAHDLHKDSEPTYEGVGEFATDFFSRKAVEVIENHNNSEPLFMYLAYQAPHMNIQKPPQKYLDLYTNSEDKFNKVYQDNLHDDSQAVYRAAAISAIDSGVKQVVEALKSSGLYDNSIIVFSTDNGGSADSSNYPLRGKKEQVYEGGVRGVGFVHSPLLEKTGVELTRMMYITDWLATLMHVAGLEKMIPPGLDTFNMWPSISYGKRSPRTEIVLNLDQDTFWNTWSAAIIVGKYKFIWGQSWLLKQKYEEDYNKQELYNLKKDPSEEINLLTISKRRGFVAPIRAKLMDLFRTQMAEADYPLLRSKVADPALFGGVLSSGWCEKKV